MSRISVVLLLVVACGGSQAKNEKLIDQVIHYHEGMRWRRFDDSASHLPAVNREVIGPQRVCHDQDDVGCLIR